MKLPNVISALIEAQNKLDADVYANCFTENAVVFDEGKTHKGRTAIRKWINEANKKYHTIMKPKSLEQSGDIVVLSTEIAGTFPGSSIILQYHFELENQLIRELKVIG